MEQVNLNHAWSIVYNPEGNGLMLKIWRGISCENHCQVISAHTTNTPNLEAVAKIVEIYKVEIDKAIDGFIEFMQSLGNWDFKDTVGVLFCNHLIRFIARESEKYHMETDFAKREYQKQFVVEL